MGRVDGKDGLLMPYLRAGYLNHGYRFFAPEPGPSHLVRYELDLKSGVTVEGKFPDPDEQWPRLLYHRMFMISETLFNLGELPVLDNPTPGQQSDIQTQRELANALASSIARRLLDQNNGERVRLYVQTHLIPWPGDVLAGQKLDDPSLYQERFVGEFSEDQL